MGNGELLCGGDRVSVLQDEEKSGDLLHNSVHVFNTIVHVKIVKIVAFMLCAFYHNWKFKNIYKASTFGKTTRERDIKFSETWANKSGEAGLDGKKSGLASLPIAKIQGITFIAWSLPSRKLMVISLQQICLGGALFKDTKSNQ